MSKLKVDVIIVMQRLEIVFENGISRGSVRVVRRFVSCFDFLTIDVMIDGVVVIVIYVINEFMYDTFILTSQDYLFFVFLILF